MDDKRPLTRRYMRETGKFFFRMTKEVIRSMEVDMKRNQKIITALAATSAVTGIAGLILAAMAYLK